MKKSTKKTIFYNFILILSVVAILLSYVGIKLKYDMLKKKHVVLEREISRKNNWRINLLAERQDLNSKERIVSIAKKELGLVKINKISKKIVVSKIRITELKKKLKVKYE